MDVTLCVGVYRADEDTRRLLLGSDGGVTAMGLFRGCFALIFHWIKMETRRRKSLSEGFCGQESHKHEENLCQDHTAKLGFLYQVPFILYQCQIVGDFQKLCLSQFLQKIFKENCWLAYRYLHRKVLFEVVLPFQYYSSTS